MLTRARFFSMESSMSSRAMRRDSWGRSTSSLSVSTFSLPISALLTSLLSRSLLEKAGKLSFLVMLLRPAAMIMSFSLNLDLLEETESASFEAIACLMEAARPEFFILL